jgi:hypothetical protein
MIACGLAITLLNSLSAYGRRIDSIYMDFMKAFDKVPHRRLIKKMQGYGIGKRILNWVKDFLKNRKQNVSVNGAESACQDVTRLS